MKQLLSVIWILLTLQTAAQEPAYRNISVKQGLPSNEVYDVLQDRKGYIWFSTDAGVCRYNGSEMKVFTVADGLSDNVVFGMHEDKKGRIWFRTLNNAISYYYEGNIYQIGANRQLREMKIPPPNNSIFVGEGDTLWLGLNHAGIVKIAPDNNYAQMRFALEYMRDSSEQVMIKSPYDNLWVEGGLFGNRQMPRWRFVIPNRNDDVQVAFSTLNTKYASSQKGRALHYNNGILLPAGDDLFHITGNNKYTRYNFPARIQSLCSDARGGCWVGMYINGVYYYPYGLGIGKPIHLFKNVTVSKVFTDYEGGTWCITIGKGIFYIPNLKLYRVFPSNPWADNAIVPISFVRNEGEPLQLHTLNNAYYQLRRNGFVLSMEGKPSGKGTGINAWDYAFTGYPIIIATKANRSHTVMYHNNISGLWGKMINPNTFYRYHANRIVFHNTSILFFIHSDLSSSSALAPFRINEMTVTSRDELYIGTNNGIYRYNDSAFIPQEDPAGLLRSRIDQLAEDKNGLLWFASRQNGIIVWDYKNTWHLDTRNGLPGNAVRSIAIDDNNTVWAATNKGIAKISFLNNQFNVQAINTSHGLESNEINCIAYSNGMIYAATAEGIHYLDTGLVCRNITPPRIAITRITANETDADSNKLTRLSFSENNIQVFFDNLSIRSDHQRRFRYQLNGFDTGWKFSTQASATYTNLPPGNYVFVVHAINSDGIISTQPARISFYIPAPFWRTPWFIILMALALLLLIALLGQWRLRRLRRKEEAKREIEKMIAEYRMTALRSQMNPHFIFNVITSIQHYVLENNSMASYDYLSKFGRLMRLVLENSKEKAIPLVRELETLRLYIELEQLRLNNKFTYELSVDSAIDINKTLAPTMLVQPYVENAVKHGLAPLKENGRLTVTFKQEGDILQIIVDDNGVGRTASRAAQQKKAHRSMGMDITIDRVQVLSHWHGRQFRVSITDKYDAAQQPAGTSVSITIPVLQ
jgi:ligand-binding sensor domain-containing protein